MVAAEVVAGAFSRFYGDSAAPSQGGGPVLLPPPHPPSDGSAGAVAPHAPARAEYGVSSAQPGHHGAHLCLVSTWACHYCRQLIGVPATPEMQPSQPDTSKHSGLGENEDENDDQLPVPLALSQTGQECCSIL